MAPVILTSVLLLAVQPASSVEFIGFSRNDAVSAWKVSVERPRADGSQDRYDLIRILDTRSSEQLATFRASGIKRVNSRGKVARVSRRQLLADNPHYEQAGLKREWLRIKRKVRFSQKVLEMNNSILRLAPNPDVQLEAVATQETIEVTGKEGSAVGFGAVVRKDDGEHVSAGEFRREGVAGQRIDARVRAFYSESGHALAVLSHYSIGTESASKRETHISVMHLDEAAVGTTMIGAVNLVQQNLRQGAQMFKATHPKLGRQYDRYIRGTW